MVSRWLPQAWRVSRWSVAADDGAPEPVTTTFAFPGSEPCALNCWHLRRALVGGTLSRNWVSWVRDGQRYAVSFRHEGSGANPVTWEDGLSLADHDYCDLDAGSQSPEDVAAAFALTAAALDGGTWDTDGEEVSTTDISSIMQSDTMDEDDRTTRGMWGMQRDFGWADGSSFNGGMGATGAVHVPSPGNGRILGVYVRATGGNNMRLGLGEGPAYATDPTAIAVLGQGVAPAVSNNNLGVVLFSEPIASADDDEFWVIVRAAGGQGFRLRDHSVAPTAPVGRGDIPSGQQLIWSALSGDPAVSFGATVDVGGGGGPYPFYAFVGLIQEQPVAGRYRNNGIRTWHGYQGAALAGSYNLTDPTDMVDENVGFRARVEASIRSLAARVVAIRQAVGTRTAGDDFNIGLYSQTAADVPNFPSLTPPELLQHVGPFGVSAANQYNTHTLSASQSLAGVEAFMSAWTCARTGDVAATSLQFVYNENGGGGLPSVDHWEDDGRDWSDWIDEGSFGDPLIDGSGLQNTEYQARESNGSTMPAGSLTAVYPDPYAVDSTGTTDAAPLNVPRGAFLIVSPGISVS